MKDEKGREMGVAGREVGGRMATPWAPEKAEEVRENLQRAPGWRNLSILQFEGSCCMCSNEGFSCIETNWFFKLQTSIPTVHYLSGTLVALRTI